jgi:hypothetical protein
MAPTRSPPRPASNPCRPRSRRRPARRPHLHPSRQLNRVRTCSSIQPPHGASRPSSSAHWQCWVCSSLSSCGIDSLPRLIFLWSNPSCVLAFSQS